MKYIADTLGIKVNTEEWGGTNMLPYYLIDRYEFKKAIIEGVTCLFIKPRGELDTLTNVKKHIANVRGNEPMTVILELDGMTARRRRSLIEAHIPFVACESQIYLPFLGISLSERYTSIKPPSETLMPSSQLLLFYYLSQKEPELRAGETADFFNLSAMQISRAVSQLTALGLMSVRKDGVRIVISGNEVRRDLFEKAKPYLLNPVRKRIYVEYEELPTGLFLSGYSALSEMTMLGEPLIETFAYYGKAVELIGTATLIDNTVQAEVEIWRYDPTLLSKRPGVVDALSLVASLPPDDDERVEQAKEGLLKTLWGQL